MRSFRVSFVAVLLVGVTLYQWATAEGPLSTTAIAASSCGLAQPAFCDTFDRPTANNTDMRSGDLNGVVWGVSRSTTADDPSQGADYTWFAPTATICGVSSTFNADNDVKICNGQVFETNKDGGSADTLAMYPRQPFDIASRTGTVAFDVSADGLCNHCAWPSFVYSDQPVPAPRDGSFAPRNGVEINFFSVGACNTGQESVGEIKYFHNYATSSAPLNETACVNEGSAGGPLNHFEIRMSPTHIEVWGTDPGASTLIQLATSDFQLPLTRGLVWMEDQHYNANKDSTQGTHTFAWDNFGFDGPVLPRDLGFDVQNNQNDLTTDENLGYKCQPSCTININNVTGLSNATAALLEFNWTPHIVGSLSYSFNGNPAHLQPWPYPDQTTYAPRTLAVPVPLSELQQGTNTFVIDYPNDMWSIANIDLILVGAGGTVQPGGTNSPSTATPMPAATSTPSPTAPAATSTPTPTSTPVPPTATATATSVPPTATATATPVRRRRAPGPPAFNQVNDAVPQSSESVVQVSYQRAQTAGDTNILAIGWNDSTSTISSVTDSLGNTYQVAVPTARGQNLSQAIFYASNVKAAAAGANTVTVKFNTAVPFADVRIMEYSGLAASNSFDAGASSSGGVGAATSGSFATHSANELIVGAAMTNGGFAGAGFGYTTRVITSPDADIVEDRISGATGSYTATAPINDVWVMQAAAFHAPTSPAPAATN